MRRQKGLCIELNDESSIFLAPNGEFVHGKPDGNLAVGEQGYFYPKQIIAVKKRRTIKPMWAPAIAAVAVAVLFLSVLLPKQEAFAYIQVQVNPGIELGINEAYEVISIRELNADGLELIGELEDWKHQSFEEVLDKVIALSMADTTDEIVITTVADEEDEIADKAVVDSVMAISTKVMSEKITVRLKEASKKQWRKSVEKSVPVGQLINHSEKLTKDELKKEPVKGKDAKPEKAGKNPGNGLKAEDKAKKKEEKPKKKEEKPKKKEDKAKPAKEKDKGIKEETPSAKEKGTPPGQEKRKETPAAEKGKPNPPGQNKRNEVPGQDKKDESSKSSEPQSKNGKETAPGQQKKHENKGNGNGNGNSSKAKDKKQKPKPAETGPQNSKGKNKMKEQGPAEKGANKGNSRNNGKNNGNN